MRWLCLIICLLSVHWSAIALGTHVRANVADSITAQRDTISWVDALKKKKFNPDCDTIRYPGLVKFSWRAIKGYNHALNNYDTTYVKSYGKILKVSLKGNTWFDNYDFRDDNENLHLHFYSSATSSVGFNVSLFGIGVGYQMAFDQIRKIRPRSKKFEIGYTCARFSIDYYYMRNTGDMNITFVNKEIGKNNYDNFPGMVRKLWGVSTYYYFNNRHYAPSAAYSNSLQQKRNAGSMFAGFSVSHQSFSVNPKDIPLEAIGEDDDDYDEMGDELSTWFNYTDYSLHFGYGYNWVLSKHFLLNTTLHVYSGVKHANAKSIMDGGSTFWAVNGRPRVGLAFNSKRFFASLQGYINSHFYNTGRYRFRSTLFDFSLIGGIHF